MSYYSDQEFKQIKCELLSDQVKRLEDTRIGLHNECSFLKEQIGLHRQRLYLCQELKSMGLGLNELRLLRNTIKEMAAEKGIIYKDAIREFFKSLEKQYDIKFRLKKSTTTTSSISMSSYTDEDQFDLITNGNYLVLNNIIELPKQDIQQQQR